MLNTTEWYFALYLIANRVQPHESVPNWEPYPTYASITNPVQCNAIHPLPFASLTARRMQQKRSIMQLMRRTTPIALRVPPPPNTNPMKLAQTLHPTHLIAWLELLEADDAFLRLAVLRQAVFLRCSVSHHAARSERSSSWSGVGWGRGP